MMLLASNSMASDEQERFLEAKKMHHNQQWQEAITLFEKFLEDYPDSRRADDARFWIAYSLEKIPGEQQQAFMAFAKLTSDFPESPWADDAIMHQISLTETLIREGQDQYREFLYEKLNSENEEIKYRSAISLGRLGDVKALPVLEGMKGHEDYGPLASNLTSILQNISQDVSSDSLREELQIAYDAGSKERPADAESETAPPRESFLWFNTQRYEQYRSMLRKDDKWSDNELKQFALWHILDADEFDEFRALEDYDQKEWIRKYWKKKDPTPTTGENELFEEFERRVTYARANFSKPWDYRNFKYLPDEHLRSGWYRAPWDSRGELYIKFGEPDVRSVHAFNTEEWVYYKFGVDFLVKKYMTNIYGNAINAGGITRGMHQNQNFPYEYNYNLVYPFLDREQRDYVDWNTFNTYLDANFIYKNEMRYLHDYDADPLSEFEMEVFSSDSILFIRYQFPVDELELIESGDMYEIKYTERYSILDRDMREVATGEENKHITNIADDDQLLQQEIKINLPAGEYRISIQIRDLQSKTLGIYTKDFENYKD
jgi:GWxTD domain-containing protein